MAQKQQEPRDYALKIVSESGVDPFAQTPGVGGRFIADVVAAMGCSKRVAARAVAAAFRTLRGSQRPRI